MTSRERVLAALRHEEPDRVPILDAPWPTTVERWRREGLPEGKDPAEQFGYEIAMISGDYSFRLPWEVVEETDEYVTKRTSWGALSRNWKHATSTPEWIDFTVTSRERWEELKPRLAWDDSRVDRDTVRGHAEHAAKTGRFLCFSAAVGYDLTQHIVGSERLLVAMALEPEWVKDMFDSVVDAVIRLGEKMISDGVRFDGAWFWDDMGYRNGPLFSPEMYRSLSKPAHARLFAFAHDHGLPVILHSCGCVKAFVPDLIEIGLDCLQPLEVKAGMDLVELKRTYGKRLAFMGGIDARKMGHPDPAVIEEEIRTKFAAAMPGGGYLYHTDHSVPDDVSFERYCYVMELVERYGRY